MTLLSNDQVVSIAEACLMLPFYGSALSEFEVGLVADIGGRFRSAGREAVITVPEWQVFDASLAAMRRARASRLGLTRVAA